MLTQRRDHYLVIGTSQACVLIVYQNSHISLILDLYSGSEKQIIVAERMELSKADLHQSYYI